MTRRLAAKTAAMLAQCSDAHGILFDWAYEFQLGTSRYLADQELRARLEALLEEWRAGIVEAEAENTMGAAGECA